MRRLICAFAFVSLPAAAALAFAQTTATRGSAAPTAAAVEVAALDRTVDPCTDFFQFACGGWIANHPIPSDRPRWGRFDELQDRNHEVLKRVLEQAAAGREASTKQIGDYYASCMDEAGIERKGATPLEPFFRKIAALKTLDEVPKFVAELHTIGVNAFFNFGSEPDAKDAKTVIAAADQGGLGLPDRDYYLRDDAKSAEIRKQYVAHVENMLALSGLSKPQAAEATEAVLRLETAMAKASLDRVSRRDPSQVYHKLTPAELQALTSKFNWTSYLREIDAPAFRGLNVTVPDFFRGLDQLLLSMPIGDVKAYLRWHVVHSSAPMLSSAFVNENFAFYGKALQGVTELQPRWKRCVQYTDRSLGEALGQAFVKETFGPQAKADTLKMVHAIEGALEADIQSLTWMTETTKQQALAKLHAVSDKIGYPDRWRNYSALRIVRGDALGNAQRANEFDFRRDVNKINKPVDRTEWEMTPPTVNAYYNPLENNINFPAGILQPPFYAADRDPAVNFGGAGAVVGHELTHGFDDEGRQFDAQGNLNDWWTPPDAKAFEERASCLVNQYSKYSALDDVKLNGKLTLGENTADNGGVRLALMAYLASEASRESKTIDGFSPEQRLFIGFGQIWCENRRPEFERLRAQTDPHSPGRFRVNGVVSNMPEFAKAFGCKAGAPMVSGAACRVW